MKYQLVETTSNNDYSHEYNSRKLNLILIADLSQLIEGDLSFLFDYNNSNVSVIIHIYMIIFHENPIIMIFTMELKKENGF